MAREPSEEEKARELEIQMLKEKILRTYLTPAARQRLANIRIVKPELATAVENYLVAMSSQGRINKELSDEELKRLLLALQKPKRDFRINYR